MPDSIPGPRPLVDYASQPRCPEVVEVQRTERGLLILIPPAAYWRLALIAIISGFQTALAGLALAFVALMVWTNSPLIAFAGYIALAALVGGLAMTIVQLTRARTASRTPAQISVGPEYLEVQLPPYRNVPRRWPREEIVEVNVRQAGLVPAMFPAIRLVLIGSGERVYSLLIPWSGNGALALIEDNLRDALGLLERAKPLEPNLTTGS